MLSFNADSNFQQLPHYFQILPHPKPRTKCKLQTMAIIYLFIILYFIIEPCNIYEFDVRLCPVHFNSLNFQIGQFGWTHINQTVKLIQIYNYLCLWTYARTFSILRKSKWKQLERSFSEIKEPKTKLRREDSSQQKLTKSVFRRVFDLAYHCFLQST